MLPRSPPSVIMGISSSLCHLRSSMNAEPHLALHIWHMAIKRQSLFTATRTRRSSVCINIPLTLDRRHGNSKLVRSQPRVLSIIYGAKWKRAIVSAQVARG